MPSRICWGHRHDLHIVEAILATTEQSPAEHYRKGWEPANQPGRPRFDTPVQNLPSEPVQGDLEPLRSGGAPYPAAPGQSGQGLRR